MNLTGSEHRRVHQETKRNRNARARSRRAAPVTVLRAHDPLGGGAVWVALSRRTPGTAYLIRAQADGRLVCGCTAFGFRGDGCAHVDAALAACAAGRGGAEDHHASERVRFGVRPGA